MFSAVVSTAAADPLGTGKVFVATGTPGRTGRLYEFAMAHDAHAFSTEGLQIMAVHVLCEEPLTCLSSADGGEFVTCGTVNGKVLVFNSRCGLRQLYFASTYYRVELPAY